MIIDEIEDKTIVISRSNKDATPMLLKTGSERPIIKRDLKDWLKLIATIFFVVGLGAFAINQVLEYRYNSVFLQAPCLVCADLNPEVRVCISELNTRPSYYVNGSEWTDPFKEKVYYNVTIK